MTLYVGRSRKLGQYRPTPRITAVSHITKLCVSCLSWEYIRPGTPLSLEDARRLVKGYVEHYNNDRLNSAIGYITPKDMLAEHQQEIQAERDRELEVARQQQKNRR